MAVRNLSKTLRELRRQLGITQDTLSRELHISRQLYSYYESGRRLPDVETACELAAFHHISLEDLITGQPDSKTLSESSSEFLSVYQTLTPEDQNAIRSYIAFLTASQHADS